MGGELFPGWEVVFATPTPGDYQAYGLPDPTVWVSGLQSMLWAGVIGIAGILAGWSIVMALIRRR